MSEIFEGTVEIKTSAAGHTTIQLLGQHGQIRAGASGQAGEVFVYNQEGKGTIQLNGHSGSIVAGGGDQAGEVYVSDQEGNPVVRIYGQGGNIELGGSGKDGKITLTDEHGRAIIQLNPNNNAGLFLGISEQAGALYINNAKGNNVFDLSAYGDGGNMMVRDEDGKPTIQLDGQAGHITVYDQGGTRRIHIGGPESLPGSIFCYDEDGNQTIHLYGHNGNMVLGGNGTSGGVVTLVDKDRNRSILLNGNMGTVMIGANGQDGNVYVWDKDGNRTIRLDGQNGSVFVTDKDGNQAVRLDGDKGEVHIKNWQISVPDYVLDEDYQLRPVEELRKHLRHYGHLPGIPSADEMKSEGIRLGEFSLKLLEKIEELTLYLIEQDKHVKELQHRVEELEFRNI